MQNILKWCSLGVKGLSVVAGLSAYANFIPASWMPWALGAFAIASILKDTVNRIGDQLDDGVQNNSFK